MKHTRRILYFILAIFFFFAASVYAGTIDPINKTAKFLQDGSLIYFRTTNGAPVTVTDTAITGNAWAPSWGWITFNPSTAGVTNSANGVLGGYAWGQALGWINFSPNTSSVVINSSGQFFGYAWAQNAGWIQFNCLVPGACVTTDWRPTMTLPICHNGLDDDSDGYIDYPADIGCSSLADMDEANTGDSSGGGDDTPAICEDGIDNDNDELIDFPADQGCDSATDNDETDTGEQTPFDWCPYPEFPGIQESIALCLDYCPSLAGFQSSASDCPSSVIDVCPGPNDPGIQSSLSECTIIIQADACPEISGIQASYTECPAPPLDTCITNPDLCPPPPPIDESPSETPEENPNQLSNILGTLIPAGLLPAITAASALITLFGSMLLLLTAGTLGAALIPSQIASTFLLLFGYWKRVWGVVYDSVTKQPLDPVYLILKDKDGKEVTSAITDINGRYGFLVPSGIYTIVANRTNYIFPSEKLKGQIRDQVYDDLYFGEEVKISQNIDVIVKNIPLDALLTTPDWNEAAKRAEHLIAFAPRRLARTINRVLNVLFWFGFTIAGISVMLHPGILQMAILLFYCVLYLISKISHPSKTPYGLVLDKTTHTPLALGLVHVISVVTGVEIARKTIDTRGTYYCLVPKGKYRIVIDRKNPDESFSPVFTSGPFYSKNGYINRTFLV